jgi:hypothetical protein
VVDVSPRISLLSSDRSSLDPIPLELGLDGEPMLASSRTLLDELPPSARVSAAAPPLA